VTLHVAADGYLSVEKLVSVFDGKPTHLQVALKKDRLVAGMPRMVLIILLGSLGLVGVVVCMLCATLCTSRRGGPGARKRRARGNRGNYGFHQLGQPEDKLQLYQDESEDDLGQFQDVPLTRTRTGKADSGGSSFVRPFHDMPSSDSSSEEEVFIPLPSSRRVRR